MDRKTRLLFSDVAVECTPEYLKLWIEARGYKDAGIKPAPTPGPVSRSAWSSEKPRCRPPWTTVPKLLRSIPRP